MATIYTERGLVQDTETPLLIENQRTAKIVRMALICSAAGLLFSAIGAYNLAADVKNLTNNKAVNLQQRVDNLNLQK